jgi:hypothetical protein
VTAPVAGSGSPPQTVGLAAGAGRAGPRAFRPPV